MKTSGFAGVLALMLTCFGVAAAQQSAEQRSPVNASAVANDAAGAPAIEARLLTTDLNGSPDSPVMNARLVIKNVSGTFYTYVTGWATFYDASGVRCGEAMFKLDALAANESSETDAPGLRLKCAPSTWRVVATNLLSRTIDAAKSATTTNGEGRAVPMNFVISIDGEEHPIQVNNPIVLKVGETQKRIVLRLAP